MKISKTQLDKMINEEVERFFHMKELTKKLNEVTEELQKMEEEDATLDEVKADGTTHVKSHAWTGEENGDEKFKPKFEKKGSHLLEDDMPEETEEVVETEESFEGLLAKIGRMMDMKLGSETTDTPTDVTDEPSDDDFEEIELDIEDEPGETDEEEISMEDEPVSTEDVEKMDETTNEPVCEVKEESDETPTEEAMKNLNENVGPKKFKILSEGMKKEQEDKLAREIERMKTLAKLS